MKNFILLTLICIFISSCMHEPEPIIVEELPDPSLLLDVKFNDDLIDHSRYKNQLNFDEVSLTDDTLGVDQNAALFDSYYSSIIVSASRTFDLDTSFTFSLWVKPNISQAYLIHKPMEQNGGGPYSFDFWGGNPRVVLYFNDNSYVVLTSDIEIKKGVWQYLTATWDYKELKIYYNGQLSKSMHLTGKRLKVTSKRLGIGVYQWNPNGTRFNGLMDNLQIYNVALTEDEIKRKYENP